MPGNGRRIVRALEVIELTGGPFAAFLPTGTPYFDSIQLGMACDRKELDERISSRVQRMWDLGFVAEVRELEAVGLRQAPTASRALGYAQILDVLDGSSDEVFAQADTTRATRKFARRQDAWLRRDERIRWVAPQIAAALEALRDTRFGSTA